MNLPNIPECWSRRRLLSGLLSGGVVALSAPSAATVTFSAPRRQQEFLTIYSTTDTLVFRPVIEEFQKMYPGITVRYVDIEAAPLYERFLKEAGEGRPQADVLLSASMDLQVKLVNDGYAMPHVSRSTESLPPWARWRNEAFGFTFEPVVMAFNRQKFRDTPLPKSRSELLTMLKAAPERWKGKIGTYDVMSSAVGYLLAAQDARQSSEFGALLEAMGDAVVRVHERTGDLLSMLESGQLAVGYNLMGSYVRARVAAGAPLEIVYPQDYTLAVCRTAVLPANAPHPEAAHLFLEYLLSKVGQEALARESHQFQIRPEFRSMLPGLDGARIGTMRPIVLGPGLLVALDQQKKHRFMKNWEVILRRQAAGKNEFMT